MSTTRALPIPAGMVRKFNAAIIRWYHTNRRELPWRRDRDPYRVWVSEIMLQQTRVAAVLDHYAQFMRRFPDVRTLARAHEASVLAAWSGLGYYHRARRMQQAAKLIVQRGGFPTTAEEWRALPGIGRYTAAAISSIAFDQPVAVVDGNVERVLGRVFGDGRRGEVAWQRAEALLDRSRPGDFNQAMMELGATLCTPRAPQCLVCAVRCFCETRGEEHRRPAPARKNRELNYALVHSDNEVLLVRRAADASLMAGMWELPTLVPEETNGAPPLLRLRHSITDTDYRVAVFALGKWANRNGEVRWFTRAQWERLPLTGLARKILARVPTL